MQAWLRKRAAEDPAQLPVALTRFMAPLLDLLNRPEVRVSSLSLVVDPPCKPGLQPLSFGTAAALVRLLGRPELRRSLMAERAARVFDAVMRSRFVQHRAHLPAFVSSVRGAAARRASGRLRDSDSSWRVWPVRAPTR
jgi:hypothetical protein